jgi:hypothetical protein
MTTIAADHPMPPAFRFKQSLAHNPTMLGPRFANITPILRAPVFLLETGVRPCNADLISPATIKTPYPSIVLQMSPFDAENGEVYVFTILDSRTAKIPGLVPENILSVLACSFQANGRPQVLDVVVDIDLDTLEMTYFPLLDPPDRVEPDEETTHSCSMVACFTLSALYAMTNQLLNYRTSGVRQQHRDRQLAERKLGNWGWTYRLLKLDPVKHAATAQAPGLGGSHASPRWHERRGHWRHLKDGKEVWVRHCEVGLPGRGGALHDYLVAGPG